MDSRAKCLDCSKPAEMKCSCSGEDQVYCQECLFGHMMSLKNKRHVTEPIEIQPEVLKRSCMICKENEPEVICLCGGTVTRLCSNCCNAHMAGNTGSHNFEPLDVENVVESDKDIPLFFEKKLMIDIVLGEVR